MAQLDNRLVPEIPPNLPTNKHERLAIECQKLELQLPCQPGQKWHCVNDNGRWRKHKCKFQIPLPLRTITSKKCACFTPAGVVYTRMKLNSTKMIENSRRTTRNGRIKRDVSDESIFDESLQKILTNYPSVAHLGPGSSRKKRDTLDHVDSIMEGIKDKLTGLEVSIFCLVFLRLG